MNLLVFSPINIQSGKPFGGAETSINLIAEESSKYINVVHLSLDYTCACLPYKQINKNDKITQVILYLPSYRNRVLKKLSSYLSNIYQRVSLSRLLKKYNIDIVYTSYNVGFLRILIGLKNKGASVRVILRMAGMKWYEECKKNTQLKILYNNIFNTVDSINFLSAGSKDDFLLRADKVGLTVQLKNYLIGDIGSSRAVGHTPANLEHQDEFFSLIMASRFSKYQKRQDILVKAISLIDERIPVKLLLFGDGPRKKEISKLITDLDLDSKVQIMPFIKQEKLWEKLENASLLCHATDYEGVSKIIIEAMAIGLPVLASNVPPIPDYIDEGYNGYLVNNTPEDWCHKITQLYYDTKSRLKVSNNSIQYVKNCHNPQKNIKIYISHFNELIRFKSGITATENVDVNLYRN